jgi:hypothetical protein
MHASTRWRAVAAVAALMFASAPVAAQGPEPVPHQQVISANPFGLILEWFNAEYERVVTPASTAGIGGSYIASDNDDYLNADLFWRYYPQGLPFQGWSFGVKAGLTDIPDHGTYPGYGFDVNRSWLLGGDNNFYVGLGFGLKRLIGVGDENLDLEVIPTLRIVNVGFAF